MGCVTEVHLDGPTVLDVKIEADSVNTGSGFKDDKLKGKDFFDVKKDPYITFHSTKIFQTAPNTFEVRRTFTIRGVSKPETLTREGDASGEIKGTMAFDRKEFGMDTGVSYGAQKRLCVEKTERRRFCG